MVEVLVYNLGLAISLRIKYSKKLNLNPKDTVEFVLKIWYKLGSIVRDDWLRSAVALINIINIYAGYILYSYSFKIKEGNGLFT